MSVIRIVGKRKPHIYRIGKMWFVRMVGEHTGHSIISMNGAWTQFMNYFIARHGSSPRY